MALANLVHSKKPRLSEDEGQTIDSFEEFMELHVMDRDGRGSSALGVTTAWGLDKPVDLGPGNPLSQEILNDRYQDS